MNDWRRVAIIEDAKGNHVLTVSRNLESGEYAVRHRGGKSRKFHSARAVAKALVDGLPDGKWNLGVDSGAGSC